MKKHAISSTNQPGIRDYLLQKPALEETPAQQTPPKLAHKQQPNKIKAEKHATKISTETTALQTPPKPEQKPQSNKAAGNKKIYGLGVGRSQDI